MTLTLLYRWVISNNSMLSKTRIPSGRFLMSLEKIGMLLPMDLVLDRWSMLVLELR